METLIAVAVAGGATMCSIAIALLLEFLLLKVILGAVAKRNAGGRCPRN